MIIAVGHWNDYLIDFLIYEERERGEMLFLSLSLTSGELASQPKPWRGEAMHGWWSPWWVLTAVRLAMVEDVLQETLPTVAP